MRSVNHHWPEFGGALLSGPRDPALSTIIDQSLEELFSQDPGILPQCGLSYTLSGVGPELRKSSQVLFRDVFWSLLLPSSTFKDPSNYFGPIWIIQDNLLPLVRWPATLVSFFPCNQIYSHILEIRTRTARGSHDSVCHVQNICLIFIIIFIFIIYSYNQFIIIFIIIIIFQVRLI